jgi:flavin reductase (DIM6/NTAB) family NADH-FMN oxidoreductase RutF
MQVSIDIFRGALSRLAAGVSIISTGNGDNRRGVTATAVCSVSAEPPTVLVCINTNTGTCKMVEETKQFAVSFLGQDHQSVADVFAGRSGLQGDERFALGSWQETEGRKLPVLSDAVGTLECRVEHVVRNGTHAVFFGVVENATFGDERPLIYHGGKFHQLHAEKTESEATVPERSSHQQDAVSAKERSSEAIAGSG